MALTAGHREAEWYCGRIGRGSWDGAAQRGRGAGVGRPAGESRTVQWSKRARGWSKSDIFSSFVP